MRWKLGGPPGRDEYLAGHVPGAVHLDLDADLCGPPGAGGRHPLPDPATLQAALRAAGVRAGQQVIAYDGWNGQPAARLWWTLRWAGHPEVAVLDGGWAAWQEAGGPVSTDVPTPTPGDIVVRPGAMPVLDAVQAADLATHGVLLDVRAAPRYRGEHEPIDPVAGHVPGAVNLPIDALLHGVGGQLRPPDELRARFAAAGVGVGVGVATSPAVGDGPAVGAYCGSGVTAAQAILALERVGLAGAALYVGSWSQWVTDPRRPVAIEGPL